MDMRKYFERKVGSKLHRRVTKGEVSVGGVWARQYAAEVLAAGRGAVLVNLTCHDICPSGSRSGGTDKYLGDRQVSLTDVRGLEDFWAELLSYADPEMARYLNA
jgi:hypothetical protein